MVCFWDFGLGLVGFKGVGFREFRGKGLGVEGLRVLSQKCQGFQYYPPQEYPLKV